MYDLPVNSSIADLGERSSRIPERSLRSSSAFAIIAEDLEGNLRLWSEGARRLFRFKANEVLGKPLAPILHGQNPTSLARHPQMQARATEAGRWEGLLVHSVPPTDAQTLKVTMTPWHSAARAPLGWLISASRVSKSGPPLSFEEASSSVATETPLHHSLTRLSDFLPDPFIILEGPDRIHWLNSTAEKLFGHARESLIGHPVQVLISEVDRSATPITPNEIGNATPPTARIARVGRRADQTEFPVEIDHTEVDLGGQTLTLCIIHDLSERVEAERLLRRFGERLDSLRQLDQTSLALQHPRRLATAALEHLHQRIPPYRMLVWLFDFSARTAEVLATHAVPELVSPPNAVAPLESFGLADIAELYAHRDVRVPDVSTIADAPSVLREWLPLGLKSFVRLPLTAEARLIGALEIQSDKTGHVPANHLATAREVSHQLAIAIRQAMLFQEVRSSRERLRTFSRQLLKAHEDERGRLARELHDEIGQSLTAVTINLQLALATTDRESRSTALNESRSLVDHVLQQVRDLSLDLRPCVLDDLGLVASLRWYLDRMAKRGGFTGRFSAEPPEIRSIPDIEITCFRIAQEALTNVVRHAKARQVEITLNRRGARLELVVRDDGVGFDVAAARKRAVQGETLGILGMQERVELIAGRLSIDSTPGHGTEIRARVPLELPAPSTASNLGSEV